MSNIALIGEREVIIGFNLVGLNILPVCGNEEASKALKECIQQQYAIVFITNEVAKKMIMEIEEYQKKSKTAICILPSLLGKSNICMNVLRKNVEKAVGTDILFRNEG